MERLTKKSRPMFPVAKRGTPSETLVWRYIRRDLSGCWLWMGPKNNNGYGSMSARVGGIRKPVIAHRFVYQMLRGAIPQGLQLDHLCRVRHCVNPDHLEAVTARENLMRSPTLQAENAAKTHCVHGHEFTPENTRIRKRPGGGRVCRTCFRDRDREAKRELRALNYKEYGVTHPERLPGFRRSR